MMPHLRARKHKIPRTPPNLPASTPSVPPDACRGTPVATITDVRILTGEDVRKKEGVVMVEVMKEGEGQQQESSPPDEINSDVKRVIQNRIAVEAAEPVRAPDAKKTTPDPKSLLLRGVPSSPGCSCGDKINSDRASRADAARNGEQVKEYDVPAVVQLSPV